MRKLKREKAAYEAAGLSEDATATNIRLNRQNAKYKAFSKAAGLPEQPERMRVLYPDDKSTEAANLLKLQRDAEEPIRAAIRSGEYPLTINPEKQARHMSGTEIPGRSVITIPLEELQQIVDENAGNGKIILKRDLSAWKNTEIISAGREIGYTVNQKGAIIKTNSIKIHYSKTGVHAVPYSGRWKK